MEHTEDILNFVHSEFSGEDVAETLSMLKMQKYTTVQTLILECSDAL